MVEMDFVEFCDRKMMVESAYREASNKIAIESGICDDEEISFEWWLCSQFALQNIQDAVWASTFGINENEVFSFEFPF